MPTHQNCIDFAQDLPELEDSGHVTAAMWLRWNNAAQRELWRLVMRANRWALATSADWTITDTATNTWTLPAGFRVLLKLVRDPDETYRRHVFPIDPSAINQTRGRLSYYIAKDKLYVEHYLDSAGDYRSWYVGSPTDLTATGDSLDSSLDPWSEEFCGLRMAAYAQTRDEASHNEILRRLGQLKEEVLTELATRDGDLGKGPVSVRHEPTGRYWYLGRP